MPRQAGLKPLVTATLKSLDWNVPAAAERLSPLGVSPEYVRQIAQENQKVTREVVTPAQPQERAQEKSEEKSGPVPDTLPIEELTPIEDDPVRAFLGAILPQNKVGLVRLRDTAIHNLQGRLDTGSVSNGHLLSLLRLVLEHEAALRALARPAIQLQQIDARQQTFNMGFLIDRLEGLDSEDLRVLAKQQPRMMKVIDHDPTPVVKDYDPKV